jgi:tetratricopeptide (TPR) repeat protein
MPGSPAIVGRVLPVRRCAVIAALLACCVAGAARAEDASLTALRDMARAGAPGLALSFMDESQPAAAEAPERWSEWERARIDLLAEAAAWQRAIDRLADLPPAAPEPFRRWAIARRADLHLELSEAARARGLLRELLWNAGPGAAPRELREWRRLVVRSYLVDDRIDDAVTALRRFDQDFEDPEVEWAVLRTRVLLRAGRPAEAAGRLPETRTPELNALAMLARLRAGTLAAPDAFETARARAEADATGPVERARFWFVAAEAAAETSPARRALATERGVALAGVLPESDTVFALDGDALWSAWLGYGRWYANNEQLLIGDDEAWFRAAQAAMPKFPVRSRALLAVVARQGGPAARRRAHDGLLARLAEGEPGMEAVRQAYLHSSRYPAVADVPEQVRYRLVDAALARNDMDLATRLLADLHSPPPGVGEFGWRLLRARVLVLGGRTQDGVAELAGLLGDHPDLAGAGLDRFLQVVFDLQGANEHEAALRLLQRLSLRDLPGKRHRELLYWQAESHEALEAYRRAAQLYPRSATLVDGEGGDPWGQTARYQAARMLAEAGLVSDARRIYEQLLAVTDEASRRATLRHRLQQLGLQQAAEGNLPGPDAGSAR